MKSVHQSIRPGDILSVRLFDDLQGAPTQLEIVKVLEIPQIGKSYKVIDRTPFPSGKSAIKYYFLKIPDSVAPVHRDNLRDRSIREWSRGKELNDIAETVAGLPSISRELSFSIPKLYKAGIVNEVERASSHDICGLPFVLYEWLNGEQLDKVISGAGETALSLRRHWFEFARGLTKIVARLHNHGFLHSYIVPRNILIESLPKGGFRCALAGFGYSSLSIEESLRPRIAEHVDDVPFQAPEFRSYRSLDALWHPADIFSVGAVLLYLATGTKPIPIQRNSDTIGPGEARAVAELKEEVRLRLFEAKRKFGNVSGKGEELISRILANDNVAKIIDNCLRGDPDDRFATAEELLEAIDIATTTPWARSSKEGLGPFFGAAVAQRKREFDDFTNRVKERQHFEIYGSRTKIVEGLCRMLGGLSDKAVYRTVTLPSYWTAGNLGPDGRFLAMNKHVARRGVTIQRLFFVSGTFQSLTDEEQAILESQRAAAEQLTLDGVRSFEVRVQIVDPAIVQGFERHGKSVAFVAWNKELLDRIDTKDGKRRPVKPGNFLCLNFISRGEERTRYGKSVIERIIKKVRIWDPGRGPVYADKLRNEVASFNNYWQNGAALSIEQYVKERSHVPFEDLLRRDPAKGL